MPVTAIKNPAAISEDYLPELVNIVASQGDSARLLMEALATQGTGSSSSSLNSKTILSLPSVWSPVQTISGHIGRLPIEIRKSRPGAPAGPVVQDHAVARLLNESPGDTMTGTTFKETCQLHALLYGNGRAYIFRNGLGRPSGLYLLPPDTITTMVDGEKWHSIFIANEFLPDELRGQGMGDGNYFHFPDANVLHIPGLSYNGLWGMNVNWLFRDTFANDRAGQETVSYSFANNGRPGLLLEAAAQVFRTAKDAQEFMRDFNAAHEGVRNAGKTGMIREGMKAHVLPTSATDSQHLENRAFSREDVAMIFGTQMLLHSNAVYKNVSERMTSYVQLTLARWFSKWEQEVERKLLKATVYSAKYNPWDLLKGDPNTLADYTGKLALQRAVTPNEIRMMHNLAPLPDPAMNLTHQPAPIINPSAEEETDAES